jgi:putative transposase
VGKDAKAARDLQKSPRPLFAPPAVNEQGLADHRQESAVTLLCQTLEVCVSGYDAWQERPMSQQEREEGQLAQRLPRHLSRHSRRGRQPARACGTASPRRIKGARQRVARLMRERQLAARRPRQRTNTTRRDAQARVAPTRLDRDFPATPAHEKWSGDSTAIGTEEGWLSCAAVLDVFSRTVARLGHGRLG